MRKSIVLHRRWLTWSSCTLAVLTFTIFTPGASPRGLDTTISRQDTTDPSTAEIVENSEPDASVTDTTDFSLNFDNPTAPTGGELESLETTTTTPPVGGKTGRHFGNRIGNGSGGSGKNTNNRNNIVFPALRVRPTTPVLYSHTRVGVAKRRKAPPGGVLNSTYLKGWNGSVEIASGPPLPETTVIMDETTTTAPEPSPAPAQVKFTPNPTTSQNPLLNRRRTLAELRNSRTTTPSPTTTPTPAPVKGKVNDLPQTTPTEVEPYVDEADTDSSNDSPIEASASSAAGFSLPSNPSNVLFIPPPLPIPFHTTTAGADGIFHYRYTATPTVPTDAAASRVITHAEEFGITRETYGHTHAPEDQEEEPPTTWRSNSNSALEFSNTGTTGGAGTGTSARTQPGMGVAYRDYFHDGATGTAAGPTTTGLSIKFENEPNSHEKVSIHSTTSSTSSSNHPTPSLPLFIKTVIEESPTPYTHMTSAHAQDPASNNVNYTSNAVVSQEEPMAHYDALGHDHSEPNAHAHAHVNAHNRHHIGNHHGILSRISANSSIAAFSPESVPVGGQGSGVIVIAPTPTLTTREFKSAYFTSNPYASSFSYAVASSTEYSYFIPDPGHGHHEDESEDVHQHLDDHKPSKEQQELRPSTSTISYWDTLGLKSMGVEKNSTVAHTHDHAHNPSPSPSATDLESSYSTPEAKTSDVAHADVTSPTPPISISTSSTTSSVKVQPATSKSASTTTKTIARTTTTKSTSSSEENEINASIGSGSAEEDGSGSSGGGGSSTEAVGFGTEGQGVVPPGLHLPQVPYVIGIWLDMDPDSFCERVPTFKEMIRSVYKELSSNMSSEQIVVYNDPTCENISKSKHPLSTSTTGSPPTRTTRSSEIRTGSSSKHPRTKRDANNNTATTSSSNTNGRTTTTTLYAVYIYVIDKNGTYDPLLTESFVDLWNNSTGSRVDDEITFFNKIRKVVMISSSVQSVTGQTEPPTNENAGIIAAITISAIAAVCLLVIGILLLVMRHRQAKTKFAKRCTPVTLDDYSLDNISVFNSFRRKQRNRASKRSYTNAGFEDHNAPTKPMTPAVLMAASTDISTLAQEFASIPNVNPTLDDIPSGAETKNRFANVIPMPDSRVLLTFQDEQPNSDYINANFVRGASNTNKAYIITQGPLDETTVDFWRMIWEQQVRVIFMLTDFAEAGIPKCAEYYPRSETLDCSQLHGDFQVTLEKRDVTENCITSNLVIKDMERSLRRDVVHLWYHSWPEKGAPAHAKNTTDFLIKSRKFTKEPCPVVVHCSPGTGRSGTLVACDIGMKELENLHVVDIPQIVKRIRQDRAGSVQTKEQYKHIYDVLQYYASKLSSTQLDSV